MSLCLPGYLSLYECDQGWMVDDGSTDWCESLTLTPDYLDLIIKEHEEAVVNLKHFKETQKL